MYYEKLFYNWMPTWLRLTEHATWQVASIYPTIKSRIRICGYCVDSGYGPVSFIRQMCGRLTQEPPTQKPHRPEPVVLPAAFCRNIAIKGVQPSPFASLCDAARLVNVCCCRHDLRDSLVPLQPGLMSLQHVLAGNSDGSILATSKKISV